MRLLMFLIAALGIAFTGCTYPPANIMPEPVGMCETEGAPAASDMLFVTERMPNCATGSLKVTDLRGSRLMYGAVSQDRTVRFYRPAEWWAEYRKRIAADRSPLLFVHGYNNSDQDALSTAFAIRTAVAPGNMAGGGHEVIALTWPSYAELKKYWWDEANAVWAVRQTQDLISALASAGRPVTIVAHSMGNRIALEALMGMPAAFRRDAIARLVMASADVDRATAIADLPNLGIPVTVYASTRDQALSASWRDHGLPRAGDLSTWFRGRTPDPRALTNSPGVEVVDTSPVTRGAIHHTDYIGTLEGAADLCRVVNGRTNDSARTKDSTGLRWVLLKNPSPDPADPCVASGHQAATWLPE